MKLYTTPPSILTLAQVFQVSMGSAGGGSTIITQPMVSTALVASVCTIHGEQHSNGEQYSVHRLITCTAMYARTPSVHSAKRFRLM